ncbi:SGNH/GDSL hydrolase family protein [Solicola gregarius]|uniref:SGNH/GDSL hydrolase family protein n=1 Tax=Solicola gregarius TaxID=2908642 RepID=A0AA46TLT0_9ACTN|nr:SGNH/GDSL hydrolase family protein [Solicola gregarius]UYM07636.1 SGNH/GDSL hydrolase family protein [Solicola gregarius]
MIEAHNRTATGWRGMIAASSTALVVVLAPAAVPDTADATAGGSTVGGNTHPVVTWGASADRTDATMSDKTVRNIVHTSVTGSDLRVSLSNAFGTVPVTFDSVYVGDASDGSASVTGNRRVTFSEKSSITVPPGAEVLSDPLPGRIPAESTLAVSVHTSGDPGTVTGHNVANQTSYIATGGDHAADLAGDAYDATTSHWYWVDGLVVEEPLQVETVALFGDSITDGNGSTAGANHRWPDYLARRMTSRPRPKQFGVMNEGISGNKVLADGSGVSAQARFDRDVLAQPGIDTVVILEGINDIRHETATEPEDLTAAYRQLIRRAHANGVCVVGATMTPWAGGSLYSEERNRLRIEVNHWIRTSGQFDSVIDFDKGTRDPDNPKRFLPAYDSGDHLHPGDEGYQAMADTVRLRQLDCNR